MSGKFSLDKGKRGERELISILNNWITENSGNDSRLLQRNTLAYHTGGEDVVGAGCMCIEIKNHSVLNIKAWWEQAKKQAESQDKKIPVLFYKIPRKGWIVRFEAFLESKFLRVVDLPLEDYKEIFLFMLTK